MQIRACFSYAETMSETVAIRAHANRRKAFPFKNYFCPAALTDGKWSVAEGLTAGVY
jgi:hypothetical protein